MIEIDTALLIVEITVITALCGALYRIMRIFAEFRDIPKRVKSLEEKVDNLDGLDIKELNTQLSDISAKIDTDYRQIQRISDSQVILIEGMMNLFRHVVDGNNTEKMQESYRKMEMDLVKANMDVV